MRFDFLNPFHNFTLLLFRVKWLARPQEYFLVFLMAFAVCLEDIALSECSLSTASSCLRSDILWLSKFPTYKHGPKMPIKSEMTKKCRFKNSQICYLDKAYAPLVLCLHNHQATTTTGILRKTHAKRRRKAKILFTSIVP